jgi:hypothetical protein
MIMIINLNLAAVWHGGEHGSKKSAQTDWSDCTHGMVRHAVVKQKRHAVVKQRRIFLNQEKKFKSNFELP